MRSACRATRKAFVTSGDATRAELARRAPGPAWIIGPDRDFVLYEGLNLTSAHDASDAAFLSVTGLFDDATETPEDYRQRLIPAVERDLELICANPDRIVQKGDSIIYCGGAIADLYEEMGGRVIMAGKPFGPIYELALREAQVLMGRPVDRSRVLCIGDGVITDVLGAAEQASTACSSPRAFTATPPRGGRDTGRRSRRQIAPRRDDLRPLRRARTGMVRLAISSHLA